MPQRTRSALVCVPYVRGMLRTETHGRVLRSWPDAEFVELPLSSPSAYGKLLVELWARDGDLVIVEQDVVPPAGAIKRLLACRRLWCTHAYDGKYHDIEDMLGLVKFSAELKGAFPWGMEAALCNGVGSYNWPHWRSCDSRLAKWLRIQRITPHRHRPDALHLHDYPLPEREETPSEVSPERVPSDVSCDDG